MGDFLEMLFPFSRHQRHLNRATLHDLPLQECYDDNCLHILGHPELCDLAIGLEINISCLHTFSVYGSYGLCADSLGIIIKIFSSHDFITSLHLISENLSVVSDSLRPHWL